MASNLLKGVTVLALESAAALPAGTALLAEWGARVIKIEDPRGGDMVRGYQAVDLGGVPSPLNPVFEPDNRNKLSLGLDLKTEEGVQVLHRLVRHCDVFACNLLPKTVTKLRCDYDTLRAINPRLIYVYLSGYGPRGVEAGRPAYDYAAFWARSGIMSLLGEPDAPPVSQRPGMGDHTTSIMVAAATLGALYHRAVHGVGQRVDVSLFRTALWVLTIDLHTMLFTSQPVRRLSRYEVGNPLFNYYRTKDGRWIQLIMLQADRHWPAFCEAIERPEWRDDPRFSSLEARRRNARELVTLLDEVFSTKTFDEWARILDAAGIFWGKVQEPYEVLQDPQVRENGWIGEVGEGDDRIPLLKSPVDFSETPGELVSRAPEVGQHTEEILLEHGYSWDEIVALKEKGVIS
jgi:crotonobetainyl-CoA:carnitine CoA-transferase CaiB-like acyl-CoA transferase